MDGVKIPCDNMRLEMALESLKRNMEIIPIEELEAFVEQYNTITA